VALPVLLLVLVTLLFGLLAWGLWQVRNSETGDISIEVRDGMLVSLLVLAAFALGVFVSYMLIIGG
jgi:hypothetical protein